MARDSLAHVAPGDRFETLPAKTWNAFVDAAKDFRARQNDNLGLFRGQPLGAGLVPVKNSSGADQVRFAVLGIKGTAIATPTTNLEHWQSAPVLDTEAPTASYARKFVILQEPIRSGGLGRAHLVGLCAVKIDVKDATDEFADCIAGDSAKLRSQPYGRAQILYKESGTGLRWGYVMLGVPGSQILLGSTNAAHNKNASGTINVYRGTTKGSEVFTSGDTISAYNRFANLAIGTWVLCAYVQGGWEIIAAAC